MPPEIYTIFVCTECGAKTARTWAEQDGTRVEVYVCDNGHGRKTAETVEVVPKSLADELYEAVEFGSPERVKAAATRYREAIR